MINPDEVLARIVAPHFVAGIVTRCGVQPSMYRAIGAASTIVPLRMRV